MIKNKYVKFILFVLVCMFIWDLFDYVILVFLQKDIFEFTILDHIVYPGIVAAVMGFVFYLKD